MPAKIPGRAALISALIFAHAPCRATAILGLRTPHQVVLAADGLRIQLDDRGLPVASGTACKIYQAPDGIYVAAAGVGFSYRGTSISLDRLISAARFVGNSRRDRVRSGIASLKSEITRAWQTVWRDDPQIYAGVIQGNPLNLIFGWRDGSTFGAAQYTLVPEPGARVSEPRTEFYPRSAQLDSVSSWMTGGASQNRMSARLSSLSLFPNDLPRFAAQLIQLEIDADAGHTSVGRPIDVLVIDSQGVRWYDRTPESNCPPLK